MPSNTPHNDDLQWTYHLDHSFWQRKKSLTPDHLAQVVTVGSIDAEERGHDLQRIPEEVYDNAAVQYRIDQEISRYESYRAMGGSAAMAWEHLKSNLLSISSKAAAKLRKERHAKADSERAELKDVEADIEKGNADASAYERARSIRGRLHRLCRR